MELFQLFGSIFLDDKEAKKGLDEIDGKAEKTGGKFGKVAKGIATGAAVVGGALVAAGGSMMALAAKTGDYSDRILDLNAITGMSTDSIQEWQQVAKVAGVDTETVTRASEKLTKTMYQLQQGTGAGTESLQKLGLSYDELNKLSPDEQMDTLIKKLGQIEDPAERARVGTDLFGKQWANLAPVVSMGGDAIDGAKDQAHELGAVLSNETLNDANNFRIAMENMKTTISAAGMQIGAKFAPLLTDVVMPAIQSLIPIFVSVAQKVSEFVMIAIEGVQRFVEFVKQWVSSNSEQIGSLREKFNSFFSTVSEYIQAFIAYATALWNQYGADILSTITAALSAVVAFVKKNLDVLLKFWQENGAQIMAAVKNAFELILGIIKFIMPLATSIIKTAWTMIKGIFDSALNVIMGLLKVFSGLFTGDFKKMGEGLKQIWKGLWSALAAIISGAWSLLAAPFRFIWSKISSWFTGLKKDAINWGKNMIQGFIDGISAMIGKVKNVASKVTKGIKGFLGFNSPAKEGEGRHIVEWGANMLDGFLEGAESMIPDAKKLMNKTVGSMQPDDANLSSRNNQTETTSSVREVFQPIIKVFVGDEEIKDMMFDYVDGEQNIRHFKNSFMGGLTK